MFDVNVPPPLNGVGTDELSHQVSISTRNAHPGQDSIIRRVPGPDHDRIDKGRLSLPTRCSTIERRDGSDNPVLDGVVPFPPGDAVWLVMIEYVRDDLPRVATLAAPGVPVAEPPGDVQLKATKAGSVNEIPVTESNEIARLKKVVRGGVGGEGLDGFPLVHETRQLRDEVALHFVAEEPDNQACAGRRLGSEICRCLDYIRTPQ
ncbi:hypothetical protein NPIL_623911 [Nephila pilipes]|uniref:Uncharacterized protein n=1 Tax=Nephila pilipes TaxID=299642 RepID=A0A8X6U2W6_NEPPI|nr:hypothetical protein NPIL_623911 [Nephila pilipes]